MSNIEDKGWTLHYTIGSVLAAKVEAGDLVYIPGGQDDLVVTGGRAPARAKDCGVVFARCPTADDRDAVEMQPDVLGLIWISAAGGWAKLPHSSEIAHTGGMAAAAESHVYPRISGG